MKQYHLVKYHPAKSIWYVPISTYLIHPLVDDIVHNYIDNCWWQWVTLIEPSGCTKVDPIVSSFLCHQPLNIPILPHKLYDPIPHPVIFHGYEGPLPVHCVCLCYRPLVYGVCSNYELVEFQPHTVIPPKPRLCHLLLHRYYWFSLPSPPSFWCTCLGGRPLLPRHLLHQRLYFSLHKIIRPTGASPVSILE